jgi:hypothetical protein
MVFLFCFFASFKDIIKTMTSGARIIKQIIFLVVFLLIVGGIGFGGYTIFKTSAPTPTPTPEISLNSISILSTQLINVENNDYDFLAKVINPNTDYGSPDVEYEISFFNMSGVEVGQKTDVFYILPGQTKYIINSPLKFGEPIARGEMRIRSVEWQKMDPTAQNNISLVARNYSYNLVSDPGVFSKIGGQIFNNSDFDLGQVGVFAILYDSSDKPIAVGKTEILTFLAKTNRGFETSWYVPFVGEVIRQEVDAYTNVFENSNFLKSYGGSEKFQQFY